MYFDRGLIVHTLTLILLGTWLMLGKEMETYFPELQCIVQAANPGTADSVETISQSLETIVLVPVTMRKPLSWSLDCSNGAFEILFQIETELTMLVSTKLARIWLEGFLTVCTQHFSSG